MDVSSSILICSGKSLLLAAALGALIGMEREWAQRAAGLRTFSLVSLGAALFMIINGVGFSQYWGISGSDPSRTLGQIVVGIGFLGAGIIIFKPQEGKIEGLTTAAMMWATSAVGAAVGLGLHGLAITAALLILLVNVAFLPLEKRLEKRIEKIKNCTEKEKYIGKEK